MKFPVVVVFLAFFLTAAGRAQLLSGFQQANLEVSGGEASLTNSAAAIYSGRANINAGGVISGTITRRNFANNVTNSTSSTALILTNRSRIFGPIVNEGSFTNIWTNYYSRTTNVETLFRADFYMATSISNFFVKGRATQRVMTTVEVYNDGEWVSTNTNKYTSVSLGGVSFGAGQARGIFEAD